jgi:hypothetical protein
MSSLNVLCLLIHLIICVLGSGQHLNDDTVLKWSSNFSNLFMNEMKYKMRIDEIQDTYDTTPRSTTVVDGAVELAGTGAKVHSLLSSVSDDLDQFVNKIRQLSSLSSSSSLFTDSLKSSSSMFRYFTHAKNGTIEIERNQHTHTLMSENIDGRLERWYSNAVAGPKHIFVVLDTRISKKINKIDQQYFLKRIIAATLSILSVVSPYDTLHLRAITKEGLLSELSCQGNGGLFIEVNDVIDAVKNITLIQLDSITEGDRNIWSSVLRNTFHSVENVFRKAFQNNYVGAILILSGIKPEGAGHLELNTHDLPVFSFNFPIIAESSATTSSSSSFINSNLYCTNLGLRQNVLTIKQAHQLGLFYEKIFDDEEINKFNATSIKSTTPSLTFWGGLYHSKNIIINQPIMTFSKSIYKKVKETFTLIGVACIDASLYDLKKMFDDTDIEIGRLSFPGLVNVQGQTIYHPLLSKYKSRYLSKIGLDISEYEWYSGFHEIVRTPLLNGETGHSPIIQIKRALPSGDYESVPDIARIDTVYYYRKIPSFPVVLFFAYDVDELERVTFHATDPSATILFKIDDFDQNLNNDVTSQIMNFQIYNQNNCMDSNGIKFGNCKPDLYCEREEKNIPQPEMNVKNQPPCNPTSTCECEPHRWPLNSLYKGTCIHISVSGAPNIGDENFQWNSQISGDVIRYISKMDSSENSKKVYLRESVLSHIGVSNKATSIWKDDRYGSKKTNLHNKTIWLYLGTVTGSSIVIPGNDWGAWDATRRPWFLRSVSMLERRPLKPFAIISTPYIDAGGAGLIATLSTCIWNKVKHINDIDRKHQIFGVVGFDFLSGRQNVLGSLTNDNCGNKKIFCTLIDTFGSIVFNNDFSKATDDGFLNNINIHDMFIGVLEPDIALSLIEANLLVLQPRQLSADSSKLTSNYLLNIDKIRKNGGVASGTIHSFKCLLNPGGSHSLKWYVSYVEASNTALVVVDGYVRQNGTCTDILNIPPSSENNIDRKCFSSLKNIIRVPKSNKISSHNCLKCSTGSFGIGLSYPFTIDGSDEKNNVQLEDAKCGKCPAGFITSNKGLRSCEACEAGKTASPDSSLCVACSHGKYADVASTVPCAACPAGWFARRKKSVTALAILKEASFCQICPSGWYQDRQGSTYGCIKCPLDTYSPTPGNVAKLLCVGCNKERTTRSSTPIAVIEKDSFITNSSSSSLLSSLEDSVTESLDTAFDEKPKIDTACYCKGTTETLRKRSANQYTDSKFDSKVIEMYGSSCAAWDSMNGGPYKDYCPSNLDPCSQASNWCKQKWCYVNDPIACSARGFDVAGGSVFAPVSGEINTYYSYGLCGYPDCYVGLTNWEKGVCPFGLTENEKMNCKNNLKNDGRGNSFTVDEVPGGYRTEKACLCRAGLYYSKVTNLTDEVNDECVECPEGANCGLTNIDRDGLKLNEILPLPGWWRLNEDSKVFLDCKIPYKQLGAETSEKLANERCCPHCNVTTHLKYNATRVRNSTTKVTNITCLIGYTGPLCHACHSKLNYVKIGRDCIHCDGGASLSFHILMWLVVGCSFTFCVFLCFYCIKPPKNEQDSKKRDTLLNNMKVLWSWCQLFSAMPTTFEGIAWGDAMTGFARGLGAFVSLDITALLTGLSSCQYNVSYQEAFLIYMLSVPFFMFIFIPVGVKLGKYLRRSDIKSIKYLNELQWTFMANFVQIFYPSICSKVFSIFNCVKIPSLPQNENYRLRYSYDIKCWQGDHTYYVGWAICFLILFVLGFPVGLFAVLYHNKDKLNNKTNKSWIHLMNTFYDQYEAEYYWFECLVILRKLMLTGLVALSESFFLFFHFFPKISKSIF